MASHDPSPTGVLIGLYLTASAVTVVVAVAVLARRSARGEAPEAAPLAVAMPVPGSEPIPAEAEVFRTAPSFLAIDPAGPRERTAHPRTLQTYRFLRAYPGAPPRIPHPLSADEFRTARCQTCHERGGYSRRFAAYVPVTPHPERGMCTSCHLGVDSVVGLAEPSDDPSRRCTMCHGPAGGPARAAAAATWPTSRWVALPRVTREQSPPAIPHLLAFRENCVACHAGPAAVAEIRTSHPLWTDCRQCHLVAGPETSAFVRPEPEARADGGAP